MIKGMIFDMDGVLVNSEPGYFERRNRYFKSIGLPTDYDPELFIGWTLPQVLPKVFPQLPAKDYAKVQAGYDEYKRLHPIDFKKRLMPGVVPTLIQLKARGLKLAIASSSMTLEIQRLIKALEVPKDFFDAVVSGEEVAETKPSPLIYQRALAKLALLPKEAVVIEDSPIGIQSARSAGIEVWAKRDPRFDQQQAKYIFENWSEVPVLLGKKRDAAK